ncbi:cytochrome P450 2J4-like isoform X1 [Hyla sarda]|uniref:cytochrome P450 2J4-like isoform X1 n=1 Tax=Hyla sarda TaxID=327740 RepID=UPI0024C30E4D|nr:cytochrome P450 2J4-like isoform X1 [Hyla sarda]
MLSVSQLLWLLLSFVVLTRYFKVIWASKSLPPGPVPFPFIGNLWTLGFKLHPQILTKLTESYGNIYTIWLGETPLVVLNGCKAVKDGIVSHSDVLSGRPVASLLKDLHRGRGIVMSNGDTWKQQRRFGMMTLRNLGLGNGALESQIQEEARCMVEQFRAKKGEPFDPSYILNHAVANIISALVYGHRFSIEDVTFQELTNCTHCIVENISSSWARIYDAFPWLMKNVPGPHKAAFGYMNYLEEYTKKEIEIHKENGLPGEPQDVIDHYLAQIKKSQNKEASTFDEDNLIAVVIDLFGAGTETTAIALLWGLLYMVAYPDIQQEVQKELDATSNGPQIYYKDRKNLPYTNAVIHEILRYGNIAAVGMPRTCTKNIKIRNYSLRKDTMVLANLDSVLYDPQYWKTPNQFNPQNFLDSDGNFLMNEAFMPFSAGSRVCLGEQLARSEVFNFFSTLMRSFSFQLPEGVTEVNTKYIYKLTLQPHPFRICAVPR